MMTGADLPGGNCKICAGPLTFTASKWRCVTCRRTDSPAKKFSQALLGWVRSSGIEIRDPSTFDVDVSISYGDRVAWLTRSELPVTLEFLLCPDAAEKSLRALAEKGTHWPMRWVSSTISTSRGRRRRDARVREPLRMSDLSASCPRENSPNFVLAWCDTLAYNGGVVIEREDSRRQV